MNKIIKYIVVLASLFLASGVIAQDAPFSGQFWLSSRSQVTVYLNGVEVLKATESTGKSAPVTIKPGDRIALKLHKTSNGAMAMQIAALSDDETVVCSFRNTDFKIAKSVDLKDFTPEEFATWKKSSDGIDSGKQRKMNVVELPIKNYSEWIWGDANECYLATIVEARMFKKKPR